MPKRKPALKRGVIQKSLNGMRYNFDHQAVLDRDFAKAHPEKAGMITVMKIAYADCPDRNGNEPYGITSANRHIYGASIGAGCIRCMKRIIKELNDLLETK